MKKILLHFILFTLPVFSFAQQADSIWIAIDTIPLRGVVVDHNGQAVRNIKVQTLFSKKSTFTDDSGNFHFQGIQAYDRILVEKDDKITWEDVNGSRFIKIKIKLPEAYNLSGSKEFQVKTKRIVEKPRYKVKPAVLPFDAQGHFNPPQYAGGLAKFYSFLTENIIYPPKAVINNVEGLVSIAFTVKKNGGFKDIEIIRDIGYGCADEVIRVLKKTESKWSAANEITPVEKRVIFEIPFKLTD